MKFQFFAIAAVSAASQESASPVGTVRQMDKGADFPEQAAQAINRTSAEINCNCVKGDGTFCGVDGQCRVFSCQAWYEFAQYEFTGNHHVNGTSSGGPLDCQDIDVTEPYGPNTLLDGSDVYYPSVSFRCDFLTPPPIAMGFNRRCSADKTGPHAVSEFTCYELAPTTDFQSFLAKATPANLKCPDNETTPTDDGLRFTYSATVESNISPSEHIDIDVGFNATKVFDETPALAGTMYARYKEILTEEPTTSPSSMPSSSPTANPSETPSSTPTAIPSKTPTEMPQSTPSSTPSIMPTPTPTAAAPNQTGNSAFLAVIVLFAGLVHL